jgi:hypothetical protein
MSNQRRFDPDRYPDPRSPLVYLKRDVEQSGRFLKFGVSDSGPDPERPSPIRRLLAFLFRKSQKP